MRILGCKAKRQKLDQPGGAPRAFRPSGVMAGGRKNTPLKYFFSCQGLYDPLPAPGLGRPTRKHLGTWIDPGSRLGRACDRLVPGAGQRKAAVARRSHGNPRDFCLVFFPRVTTHHGSGDDQHHTARGGSAAGVVRDEAGKDPPCKNESRGVNRATPAAKLHPKSNRMLRREARSSPDFCARRPQG